MAMTRIDNRRTVAPTVSVIVAVRNGIQTIAACVNSISAQQGVETELLLVDGASTDGTWRWVCEQASHFSWAISEPDQGIYDAWNKAVAQARGAYVCFLGADDKFLETDALSKLCAATQGNADIASCKGRYEMSGVRESYEFGSPWDWQALKKGMCLDHHALLHSRRLFSAHGPFDDTFKIAGDYEFLLRCGPGINAVHLPEALVQVGAYGVSQERFVLRLWERRRAQVKTGAQSRPMAACWFLYDLSKEFANSVINRFSGGVH